jgi:hypothetical protein
MMGDELLEHEGYRLNQPLIWKQKKARVLIGS